jgi:abnormal spindle-like microcephaly-associated protein
VGLEAVCGTMMEPAAASNAGCLADYIAKQLLFNDAMAAEYKHPSVPNCYKDGFEEANKVATVKRFLRLVLVLDHAKEEEVLDGRPCLFNELAEHKESKAILGAFCKEVLKGEGDFSKHLSMLNYSVGQEQTKLNEYNFKVANLATDLTDGVRLTRLAEILSGKLSLSNGLRLPANTKMQMEHNIGIAISAFKALGCKTAVAPKAIALGDRAQTMVLMWQLLMKTHVEAAINIEKISTEIKTLKSRPAYKNSAIRSVIRRKSKEENYANDERLNLLLEWVQAVCTCSPNQNYSSIYPRILQLQLSCRPLNKARQPFLL